MVVVVVVDAAEKHTMLTNSSEGWLERERRRCTKGGNSVALDKI